MSIKTLRDENELLAKIADGDHIAFKIIYDYYQDNIYKFAFRLLREKDEARELLQESMLHIWQLGFKLKEIKNIESYLKIIVKRKGIDLFRRKVIAAQTNQALFSDYKEEHNETEEGVLMHEARTILEDGIKQLSPQQQQVYRLCYQQGMKYNEVAEKLNISHGTVQTHMKVALHQLRKYIRQNSDIGFLLIIIKMI